MAVPAPVSTAGSPHENGSNAVRTPSRNDLQPFSDFVGGGVYVPKRLIGRETLASSSKGHDSNGVPFVPIGRPLAGLDITFEEKQERRRAITREVNQKRKADAGASALRLRQEECWKIGEPDSDSVEPERTSLSSYDISIPPFSRLLSATRDFLYSRDAEFQYYRNKRLFNLLRDALGLRGDAPGSHWPGSGPNGIEYVPPSSVRRKAAGNNTEMNDDDDDEGPILSASAPGQEDEPCVEEVCVLLTRPETSVRGFLALARREAEAGWHFEPAYKLAKITSAFLSFVLQHEALSEPELKAPLERAAQIARTAPQQLEEARKLEDALGQGQGWNRACWTVFGGSYGGAERGGMEKEQSDWVTTPSTDLAPTEEDAKAADAEGWIVDPVVDDRPQPLTVEQASTHVANFLSPLDRQDIKLLQYIPYSRRRITSVLSPLTSAPEQPSYTSRCHRIITVPAPWTPEEKWRVIRPRMSEDGSDEDDEENTGPAFDQERATIDEPDELTIWVELESVLNKDFDSNQLIGMGLRGRWAIMGVADGSHAEYKQWWTFKAKDYVLPAFWQSS